jgi:hypothetical protein
MATDPTPIPAPESEPDSFDALYDRFMSFRSRLECPC